MGFFDLNIPYPEPTPSTKSAIETSRTKIAVKAMELGYSGIAYNRTISGVMSDHHRCSVVPLTVSSLFKVLPALSLSAKLHRDALGVPLSTPFRQYTRLTVVVETSAQSHTLNSGNPILKTYDLVAVKPMNQFTFELACEKMEVDIISLDLSVKLPFRMKQPMVKAAIKRGVFFEITYSSLITDIQSRAQLISSFKVLMDFTRGKNIVFSSAAPSVNEFRGPYDVANLLSLLGFSKERAKEAISKNCRTLLTNSLRKKRFYKEAIKIDILSSDVASHSKEGWYQELLKWDPISSGEGDVLLDDLTKSLSTSCEAPKTAKAIDFDSVPSHGFQVKDFLPASNALPVIPCNETNSMPVAGKVNQSTNVLNNSTHLPNKLDVCPEPDESSLSDAIATHSVVSYANFHEQNLRSGTNEASDLKGDLYTPTIGTKSELDADVNCSLFAAEEHGSKSDLGFSGIALDTVVPHENKKLHISPEDSDIDHKVGTGSEQVSPVQSASGQRRHKRKKSSVAYSNAQVAKVHESLTKEDLKIAEHRVLETNTSISENLMVGEQLDKCETNAVELDGVPLQTADEMKTGDSTFAKHLLLDATLEDKKLGKVGTDTEQVAPTQSASGRKRGKRKKSRGGDVMPADAMKMEDNSTLGTHLVPDVMQEDKKLGKLATDSEQVSPVQSASGRRRGKRKKPHDEPAPPPRHTHFMNLVPMPFKKKGKKNKSTTKRR